jgi:hypothetical protein
MTDRSSLECKTITFLVAVFDEEDSLSVSYSFDTYPDAVACFEKMKGYRVSMYRQDCNMTLIGCTVNKVNR